jgi:hypothetical protein
LAICRTPRKTDAVGKTIARECITGGPKEESAAMEKLTVGDRVKIDDGQRRFYVEEVDPPGVAPAKPSTYCVRLKPAGEHPGPILIYGNHRLVKVDD